MVIEAAHTGKEAEARHAIFLFELEHSYGLFMYVWTYECMQASVLYVKEGLPSLEPRRGNVPEVFGQTGRHIYAQTHDT